MINRNKIANTISEIINSSISKQVIIEDIVNLIESILNKQEDIMDYKIYEALLQFKKGMIWEAEDPDKIQEIR